MAEVVIRLAEGEKDIAEVRTLMLEYGSYLAQLASGPTGGVSICIEGYETELEGLPAPYMPPGGLLLAEVDGEAAGCIALKKLKPLGQADVGLAIELKRLWVRPGHRGLRLGLRLMEAAITHVRQAGAVAAYLDTVPAAMPEANRLYDLLGFERIERYNENPVKDVVFFRLRLGSEATA